MSVRIDVNAFSVEGEDRREAATKIARFFGDIADGEVSDNGIAVQYTTTHVDPEPSGDAEPVVAADEQKEGADG